MEADIKTQLTDNQCWRGNVPFFGMTEMCICDTNGCNYEAGTHDLPHESAGNPVISANSFIVYVKKIEFGEKVCPSIGFFH